MTTHVTRYHHTPATLVRRLFADVIEEGHIDDASVDRYMAPDYRQRVDGKTLDLPAFKQHLARQRDVVASMSVNFRAMAGDDDIVFSHHDVDVIMHNGDTLRIQVLAQFTVAEGKIIACDELTHLLQGPASEKDLGSRV